MLEKVALGLVDAIPYLLAVIGLVVVGGKAAKSYLEKRDAADRLAAKESKEAQEAFVSLMLDKLQEISSGHDTALKETVDAFQIAQKDGLKMQGRSIEVIAQNEATSRRLLDLVEDLERRAEHRRSV